MNIMNRRNFLAASLAATTLKAADTKPLLIDSHVHTWKTSTSVSIRSGGFHPSPENATAEMLLDLMKANGVSRTVIIQVIHYRVGQQLSRRRFEALSADV